jgi:hypothetical protein
MTSPSTLKFKLGRRNLAGGLVPGTKPFFYSQITKLSKFDFDNLVPDVRLDYF